MRIEDIGIGERYRKDLGDIEGLAKSIQEIGLLHPVVVTSNGQLVAGQRRLAAARQLGWEEIPARIVNLSSIVRGEYDENAIRKDLLPSEAVAIGRALEPLERKAAEERQIELGRTHGTPCAKFAQGVGKSRDIVASKMGMSGYSYKKAKRVIEAAEEEPEKYAELAEEMDRTGKIDGAYKKYKRIAKAEEDKATLEAAQEAMTVAERENLESICDLRVCSCADLFRSGIKPDAVITDPPYPREFLSVFTELAESCKAADVPLVAVMSGQSYLPEVMQRLCEHLTYRWTLAYLTPGGQSVQQFPVKVNCFWKPVFLFGQADEWIGDVSRSATNDNDKRYHDWGQSESGMADLIERLTKPGQLVCDPFLGGGTTAVVSLALSRRFVGCDIDADCIERARQRIEATLCQK